MYGFIMYGGSPLGNPPTMAYLDAGTLAVSGTATISVASTRTTTYNALSVTGTAAIDVASTNVSSTFPGFVLPDINIGLGL